MCVEQTGLELRKRREQRVGEAAEARGGAEPVQRRRGEHTADEQRPLDLTRDRTRRRAGVRDALEQVVEGADRAGQKGAAAPQQVALDPVDVRPDRHDEHRVAIERSEVALEQERDLAGMSRPHDEGKRHVPIVVPARDSFPDGKPENAQETPPRRAGRSGCPGPMVARPLRTSGAGRDARPPGRAGCRRSCRRDPPAWRRDGRR